MDPIQDLDVLIAETERAVNLFRAFERLPRVLRVIQTAHNLPAELEKEIKEKKEKLVWMNEDIKKHQIVLDETQEEIKDSGAALSTIEEQMTKKKVELLDLMEKEVADAREDANAEVKKSRQKMDKEIKLHIETIKESEEVMTRDVLFHREQIDIHKRQEKIAKGLANEAKATLEKISKSLKGEE